MRLTPVLSLHTLVQCVYSHSSAHGHTFTRSKRERERGEVERRFMFWFFLNGNFCSALMFAALPTRPARQLWNEEKDIYREPRTNTSKLELALKHMYTNTRVPSRIASDLVISSAIFIWHRLCWIYPSALKLLAGDRVSSKLDWTMKGSGFTFWPQRKETHETAAHQWTVKK